MDGKRSGVLRDVKGQGLSVNAIILIILGITVLVVLILGFTIGWSRILPFVNTNNVQNIVVACDTACTTGSQYDYCSTPRMMKDGTNEEFSSDCNELANSDTYKDRNYGVNKCPSLASLCTSE
ncbi:MAG: hypothetical protein KKB79_02360 [Nanoarchaeota archaeon]|nr:hypothetical protein [Nanoarchaeota archaeon]